MFTNDSLLIKRQKNIPNGIITGAPIFIEKAENALLWDVEGKRYIDFAGGIGVLNTGHCHPKVCILLYSFVVDNHRIGWGGKRWNLCFPRSRICDLPVARERSCHPTVCLLLLPKSREHKWNRPCREDRRKRLSVHGSDHIQMAFRCKQNIILHLLQLPISHIYHRH